MFRERIAVFAVFAVAVGLVLTQAAAIAGPSSPGSYWKTPVSAKPGAPQKPAFKARVEVRYSLTEDGPGKPTWGLRDDHQSGDGYNTRRVRLTYNHQFNDDWLGFGHVRRDWGADEFSIWDLYFTYSGWEWANVAAGQMTVPFSRDYLITDLLCPLAERPLIGTLLGPKRDTGILLFDPKATDRFGWYAGIYGGEGTEELSFRGNFMPVARAEYAVTDELNVGANWFYNNSSASTSYQAFLKKNSDLYGLQTLYSDGKVDEEAWGIDARYVNDKGTEVWAGYTACEISAPMRSVDADGWYVFGGQYIPFRGRKDKLEIVAGYEEFDPNDAVVDQLDARWTTIGLKYHADGSKRQWRLQYVIRDERRNDVDNDTLLLQYDHTFK